MCLCQFILRENVQASDHLYFQKTEKSISFQEPRCRAAPEEPGPRPPEARGPQAQQRRQQQQRHQREQQQQAHHHGVADGRVHGPAARAAERGRVQEEEGGHPGGRV